MNTRIFYNWVSPKLDLPLLVIMSICLGISSGVSAQIGVYMSSGLGTNPADAAMCNYAYFAGMTVAFLMIEKLQGLYNKKHLISAICILLIGCNFIISKTDSASLMILLTFFIGILRLMGAIMMIGTLIPILMPKGQRYLLYSVYFPITLLVSPFSGLVMTWLADQYNWRFSFHFCNLLLFIALIIVTVTVHNDLNKRPIPLWKFDWFSHFLIAGWTLAFIYLLVYARIQDGWDSYKVRWATLIFVLSIAMLFIRNYFSKQPILHFEILKVRNIRIGFIIMFFFGAFFTMTNTFNTLMNISFHRNPVLNAKVNAFPMIGYLTGAVLSYFYYRRFNNFKVMILLTVALYWTSCALLYHLIDTQVSVSQLFLPMVLRGIAIVFSYITIGLYVTAQVPPKYLPIIPFFLIFFRTFLGPTVWGNLYSNVLAIRQVQLLNRLANWSSSDPTDPIFQQRFQTGKSINIQQLYSTYQQQAVLASLKELIGYICIGGAIMFVIILILPIYKKVDRKIFNWNKKERIEDLASTIAG